MKIMAIMACNVSMTQAEDGKLLSYLQWPLLYNQEFHSITVSYLFGILINPRVWLKRFFFN